LNIAAIPFPKTIVAHSDLHWDYYMISLFALKNNQKRREWNDDRPFFPPLLSSIFIASARLCVID
jgi:hypothetical protein